jgi:hypothetical protein
LNSDDDDESMSYDQQRAFGLGKKSAMSSIINE